MSTPILVAAVVTVVVMWMLQMRRALTLLAGGNMTKSMNTTAGGGNVTKSAHYKTTEARTGVIGTSLESTCCLDEDTVTVGWLWQRWKLEIEPLTRHRRRLHQKRIYSFFCAAPVFGVHHIITFPQIRVELLNVSFVIAITLNQYQYLPERYTNLNTVQCEE